MGVVVLHCVIRVDAEPGNDEAVGLDVAYPPAPRAAWVWARVKREVGRIDADRQLGPDPADVGDDVRVALALELRQRLQTCNASSP